MVKATIVARAASAITYRDLFDVNAMMDIYRLTVLHAKVKQKYCVSFTLFLKKNCAKTFVYIQNAISTLAQTSCIRSYSKLKLLHKSIII